MKIIKIKNKSFICFHQIDLSNLFKKTKENEMLQEMTKNNITFDDLRNDKEKILQISDSVANKTIKDKFENEIGIIDFLLNFYEKNACVCFELKNNANNLYIKNINDLKNIIQENSEIDVILIEKSTTGKIFIAYNEENKFNVIIEVYPKVSRANIPYSNTSLLHI
jgi:hypothetical protein